MLCIYIYIYYIYMYIYMYTVYNTYKIYIRCVYVPYFLLDLIFAPRASASGPVSVPRSWVWSCSGAFGSSSGPAVWAWPCDSGGKCRLDPPGARGWEIILFIVDLFCSYWLVVLDYGYYCWCLLILNILIIKWYLFVVYLVFIFQLYIITSLNVVTMSGIIPIIMMKWWRWSEQKRARVFARQRPLTVLTCGRTEVKTGWVHETSSLRILRLGGFEVSVWLKEARQAHEAKGTLAFWVNGPK